MNCKEYTILALRTETSRMPLSENFPEGLSRALHSALGCADEAGELVKQIKDHLFYGRELPFSKLKEEYGDLLWFIALGLDAMHSSFEEVMEMNIAKLRTRYPEKYSDKCANVRELPAELQALKTTSEHLQRPAVVHKALDLLEDLLGTIAKGTGERKAINKKYWQGPHPTHCQLCHTDITTRFVDGKTPSGAWGIMCPDCHIQHGAYLGKNVGQAYVLRDKKFEKAEACAVSMNSPLGKLLTEVNFVPSSPLQGDTNVLGAVISGMAKGKIVMQGGIHTLILADEETDPAKQLQKRTAEAMQLIEKIEAEAEATEATEAKVETTDEKAPGIGGMET